MMGQRHSAAGEPWLPVDPRGRRPRPGLFSVIALLAMLPLVRVALRPSQGSPPKKLIQFGWGEPSTSFLRRHVREMERLPFDGVVLNAGYRDGSGREALLHWRGFSAEPIPWASLEPALRDLQETPLRRFRDSFLRFNVTPGDVSWGDEAFSGVVHNARMAGRLVGGGGLRGILLDVEQYQHPLFRPPARLPAAAPTPSAYEELVRRRGREIMQAFQAEAPDLVVFLTFGYSLASTRPESYGLLRPFLDGLYEAAAGETRVVDGFEFSYPYQRVSQFERAYQVMRKGGEARSAVPGAYRRRLLAGFGVWMDYDRPHRGWDALDVSRNYFTPRGLENALAAALRRSDRYVWLYSEAPRFWVREALPEAYLTAIRRARSRAGLPPAR
jgi:hypothetical protein